MSSSVSVVQAAAAAAPPEKREFVPASLTSMTRGGDAGSRGVAANGSSSVSVNDPRVSAVSRPPSVEALRAELGDSVQIVNERLAFRGQSLNIDVDPATGAVVVKISDDKTGEVVRQIPSEDMLRIARNIEVLTGILVDQKE
jgi:flagellar protein FlaG